MTAVETHDRPGLPYSRPPRESSSLLLAVLSGTPDLSDGACLPGRHDLPASAWDWDAGPGLRYAAAQVCLGCPALEACADWALTLPRPSRDDISGTPLTGVVAGLYRGRPVPPPYREDPVRVTVTAGLAAAHGRSGRVLTARRAFPPPATLTEPGKRAWLLLLDDCQRTNVAIAALAGLSPYPVRRTRLTLEASGAIPAWRPPPGPGRYPVRDRVRAALAVHPDWPNAVIARMVPATQRTVKLERASMGMPPAPPGNGSTWRAAKAHQQRRLAAVSDGVSALRMASQRETAAVAVTVAGLG